MDTLENTEGVIKMDNLEKLATLGTHDEKKQNRLSLANDKLLLLFL